MKVVLYCNENSTEKQLGNALEKIGFEVCYFLKRLEDVNYDIPYMEELIEFCGKEAANFVWGMEYVPVVSRACALLNIPYISWVTEKQAYTLYSKTLENSVNYVFLAEESLYQRFKNMSKGHIFYMMPGAELQSLNVERGIALRLGDGTLSNFHEKKECSEYLKGYLRGMIEIQKQIYGNFFVEKIMTEKVKKEFAESIERAALGTDYKEEPIEYIIDDFVCDNIIEREKEELEEFIPIDFSIGKEEKRLGDINIHITNRKWRYGLDFEAIQIMGAGGFLITNYQEGMEEYFSIGEEVVIFEDYNDLKNKIAYYTEHEEERKLIAENAKRAVKEQYDMKERVMDMCYILESCWQGEEENG